jgi:hypothetical protein
MRRNAMVAILVLVAITTHSHAFLDNEGPSDAMLAQFGPTNPAVNEVRRVLASAPSAWMKSTYRELLDDASHAARELYELKLTAAEEPEEFKTRPADEAGALELALKRYRDSLFDVGRALDASRDDPVRWMVVARCVLALAQAPPSYSTQSILFHDKTQWSSYYARKDLVELLADCASTGYRLRESVFSKVQGAVVGPSVKDSLERSRAVVPRGLKIAQAANEAIIDSINGDSTLKAFTEWMTSEFYFGVHPAKRGRIQPSKDSGGPVFAVFDVPDLVPWVYGLAEAMGLGSIVLSWDVAGTELTDSKPGTTTVVPRIDVNARFAIKSTQGNSDVATLTIYKIKIRGQAVDSRTLDDPLAYRARLKKYVQGKSTEKAPLVDSRDVSIEKLLDSLSDPKVAGRAVDLTAFHNAERRALGEHLGNNDRIFDLLERIWGKKRPRTDSLLEEDLSLAQWVFLIVRSRHSLWHYVRDAPQTESVEPFDIEVAGIAGVIHDRFDAILDGIEHKVIDEVATHLDMMTILDDEGVDRGTTFRAISTEIRRRRERVADVLQRATPNWLPKEFLFHHPEPDIEKYKPRKEPSSVVVAALSTLWFDAEVRAEDAVANSNAAPLAWREFCATVANVEDAGLSLRGGDFGKDERGNLGTATAVPLLAGRVRPRPASDVNDKRTREDLLLECEEKRRPGKSLKPGTSPTRLPTSPTSNR